jgi:hypothetical protein
MDRPIPDLAEPVIGPAKGGTRWLNPGYMLGGHPQIRCNSFLARTVLAKPPRRLAFAIIARDG